MCHIMLYPNLSFILNNYVCSLSYLLFLIYFITSFLILTSIFPFSFCYNYYDQDLFLTYKLIISFSLILFQFPLSLLNIFND